MSRIHSKMTGEKKIITATAPGKNRKQKKKQHHEIHTQPAAECNVKLTFLLLMKSSRLQMNWHILCAMNVDVRERTPISTVRTRYFTSRFPPISRFYLASTFVRLCSLAEQIMCSCPRPFIVLLRMSRHLQDTVAKSSLYFSVLCVLFICMRRNIHIKLYIG